VSVGKFCFVFFYEMIWLKKINLFLMKVVMLCDK